MYLLSQLYRREGRNSSAFMLTIWQLLSYVSVYVVLQLSQNFPRTWLLTFTSINFLQKEISAKFGLDWHSLRILMFISALCDFLSWSGPHCLYLGYRRHYRWKIRIFSIFLYINNAGSFFTSLNHFCRSNFGDSWGLQICVVFILLPKSILTP